MKITNGKIYDTVKEVVGEDSLKVVEFLKDKKNISDFKIAEKVKADIHEIRNILYRLYNHNLVTYYRKKDRQKGWYISYWTFNKKRIKDLMIQLHYSKIAKFTERLQVEEANRGNFYLCPNACIRVNFESATDRDFKCPECGSILNMQDNDKTIMFLQDKIKEIKRNPIFSSMDTSELKIGNGLSIHSPSNISNGSNKIVDGNRNGSRISTKKRAKTSRTRKSAKK
jgi:transcription initiation factor TFIIE subunit alpha